MVPVPEDLPEMEYRYLGRSGLQVSAISLGGWLTYGGHVENENTFACMKAAYDAGINFFDCAEGYAGGESERIMGEAIRKFGWKRNDLIYWGQANGERAQSTTSVSPASVSSKAPTWLSNGSNSTIILLGNLRMDCRRNRLSAHATAQRLNLIAPIMEQPQYNLLARQKVEGEFLPLYNEFGLGLTTFSPLKFGFLTGKYNAGIPSDSRLGTSQDAFATRTKARTGDDSWKEDIAAVEKLMPVAEKLGISMANLAMSLGLEE
ncbi:hypothetical protein DID88_002249 [Monilinia fructigena]|uniref:NADP-dependent oxidoreductase domain-containing protein n=1 Tax=Monilinia fructigena TaxID=38457 RepID=A0A395IIM2_9HELO|nr:hypothetical protein DID88_002249 [Monilinia fructigena]